MFTLFTVFQPNVDVVLQKMVNGKHKTLCEVDNIHWFSGTNGGEFLQGMGWIDTTEKIRLKNFDTCRIQFIRADDDLVELGYGYNGRRLYA